MNTFEKVYTLNTIEINIINFVGGIINILHNLLWDNNDKKNRIHSINIPKILQNLQWDNRDKKNRENRIYSIKITQFAIG